MSKTKPEEQADKVEVIDKEKELKSCFVIMPISDPDGYPSGHFQRVYDGIIKPACKLAGFKPRRADETKGTNVIIIDILQQILSADMAICDISSKNGNVFYELGIRQAFDKPVTLMKDERTDRLFDTNTIREVPYDSNLRFDQVSKAIIELAEAIEATYEKRGKELNSLVGLLQIEKAEIKPSNLSNDTKAILEAINNLNRTNKQSSSSLAINVEPIYGFSINFDRVLTDQELLELEKVFSKRLTTPIDFTSGLIDGYTYITIKTEYPIDFNTIPYMFPAFEVPIQSIKVSGFDRFGRIKKSERILY